MKKDNKQRVAPLILSLLGAGAILSSNAYSAELTSSFRLGYIHTDNIFLDPTAEQSESILTTGFSLSLTEETSRTQSDVRLTADYLDYNGSFDSEWLAGLDASLIVSLLDERLDWVFEDTYGNQQISTLGSPDPANRENINFFSTGPNLQVPMGERFFLNARGRYSKVTYSESSSDDNRIKGTLEFARRANSESLYSVVVSSEKVKLDDVVGDDEFDINEVYLNYGIDSSRNVFNVNLGYTEVDQGPTKLDGTLARVDWTRFITESKRLTLAAGTQYSTDGDIFQFIQRNGRDVGDVEDTNGDNSPFRSDFLLGRFEFDAARTSLYVEVDRFNYDYETDPVMVGVVGGGSVVTSLDRNVSSFRVGLERRVTQKVFVRANTGYRINDFKALDREDKDLNIDLGIGFRFSEAFNVLLSGRHIDRESSVDISDFVETRYTLQFNYIPAWGRER